MKDKQIAQEYNVNETTIRIISRWMAEHAASYSNCTELAEAAIEAIVYGDNDGNDIHEDVFFELAARFDYEDM